MTENVHISTTGLYKAKLRIKYRGVINLIQIKSNDVDRVIVFVKDLLFDNPLLFIVYVCIL